MKLTLTPLHINSTSSSTFSLNHPNFRNILRSLFTVEQLIAFLDDTPFHEFQYSLPQQVSHNQISRELLEHARRHGLLFSLFELLISFDPSLYENHQPFIESVDLYTRLSFQFWPTIFHFRKFNRLQSPEFSHSFCEQANRLSQDNFKQLLSTQSHDYENLSWEATIKENLNTHDKANPKRKERQYILTFTLQGSDFDVLTLEQFSRTDSYKQEIAKPFKNYLVEALNEIDFPVQAKG